jgi:undecaprenyl-phosphate galactose phosphotransferase
MGDPSETKYIDSSQFLAGSIIPSRSDKTVRSGLKRAFDAVTAGTVLAIISPIMLLIWLAVRLDGGAGFYGHRRVGHGGIEFHCLKFRSMVVNADEVLQALLARDPAAREEWERSRKLLRDPRVTRVGRFLRATSLDELPQLFNVLRGDMSLVGPRPVVRAEIDKFYHGADRAAYFSVRPGVTGLWQVSGRSDASYDQRVRLDREYVLRASFAFDMLILLKTVAVVLKRRGAY